MFNIKIEGKDVESLHLKPIPSYPNFTLKKVPCNFFIYFDKKRINLIKKKFEKNYKKRMLIVIYIIYKSVKQKIKTKSKYSSTKIY